MDAQKIRKIIAPIIEAEVRRILPRLIKESLGGLVLKNMITATPTPKTKQTLREVTETPIRRAPRSRGQLAALLGYDDPTSMGIRVDDVPAAIPTSGPDGERIDTSRISDTLKKALTRDYSALMKALEAKKNG